MRYILEAHPPKDTPAVYEPPPNTTNLQLAVDSRVPEAVWLVLENKVGNEAEIKETWDQITSQSGREAFVKAADTHQASEVLDEITRLIASFGKFDIEQKEQVNSSLESSRSNSVLSGDSSTGQESAQPAPRVDTGRPPRGKPSRRSRPQYHSSVPDSPATSSSSNLMDGSAKAAPSDSRPFEPRGRGRGRGGRGQRGRGGYRGRGQNPVA